MRAEHHGADHRGNSSPTPRLHDQTPCASIPTRLTCFAPLTSSTPSSRSAVRGRKTRLGLIGTGFIADVHLQVLASVPEVQVVAVCDVAAERARKLADKHGVPQAFGSLDEMLANAELDAVHVLVPPALHARLAATCLEKGLHVLVEKPLVLRADEVADLQRLADEQQVVLAVNHNQTFHP
ncbi:MAG TPA: Gfo/Idh/MocA family oxidoreductase, partial [bacterium]|nr:Gfo/Idh/MocA family oxidoreductase [bacterium]